MRKLVITIIALALGVPAYAQQQSAAPAGQAGQAEQQGQTVQGQKSAQGQKEFWIYTDKGAKDNHFAASGWMGDANDIKLLDTSTDNPHSGKTCMQFTYTAKRSSGQGWVGVYWQNPANNWGSKKGGFDLTGLNKVTFWARGAKGGEIIQKFTVGGIKGTYPDSTSVEMGPVELTDQWKQYTINLTGKDLSYISGGFGWVSTADLDPNGITFFLDDIKYEADPNLKPEGKKQEAMPFYIYGDRSSANNHYIPSGYMGDFGDIKVDTGSKEDPYLGDTCVKIIYSGKATQGARWAGCFWQNPANNWGTVDKGFDLSKAQKLTFWARGLKGGERIEEFKVGGIMGEYSDSDSAAIGPVILNKDWTQYTIDLKGKDLSYIIGAFAFATNVDVNPDGCIFYLDEIKFE